MKKKILDSIERKRLFIFLFIFYFTFFTIWLLGFTPGVFSTDSLYQWKSIDLYKFDSLIPISHTVIVLLLRKIWNNPIIVVFFQIFISSILLSYIMYKYKMKYRFNFIFIVFTIISPSFAFYNITIWKDIICTQLILILCLFFYKDFYRVKKNMNILSLLLLSSIIALVSSVRMNTVVYLVLIPLLYLIFKILNFKNFTKMLLFSFFFYFVFTKIPYFFLNIDNSRTSFYRRSNLIQFAASIISGNGFINEKDKMVLEKLMPISEYKNRYRCSAIDYLYLNNNYFDEKYFGDVNYIRQFDKTAINLIFNNLPIVIGDRVCLFSHLVGLGEDRWSYLFVEVPSDITQIGYSYNGNENVRNILYRYLFWSKKYPQRIFFWSHWFTLLIYIGFFINAVLKRKKAVLGCLLIILMNVFVLFFIGVARDYRYLYMLQYCLPFIFVIGLNNKKNEK